DIWVLQQLRADVVERPYYPALRQQSLRLLSRRSLLDDQGEGSALVEPERVHTVDDHLPGNGWSQRCDQLGMALPGHGQHYHVAGLCGCEVGLPADHATSGSG